MWEKVVECYIMPVPQPTKAMCSWFFVHNHFYAKTSMRYRWLFDYFSRFVKTFLCYFFQKQASKDCLTQGNLFANINNVIKWKTKQSRKGKVWKYLFILPVFFTSDRKKYSQNMLSHFKTNEIVFYFIFLDKKTSI